MKDDVISPVFNAVLSKKRPSFEEQKLFRKKTKTILNYCQRLKVYNQRVSAKVTKFVEHVQNLKVQH